MIRYILLLAAAATLASCVTEGGRSPFFEERVQDAPAVIAREGAAPAKREEPEEFEQKNPLESGAASVTVPEKEFPSTRRWYKVYWAGIYVGDIFTAVERREGGVCYFETVMNSRNLAKLVSGYKSRTVGEINCPGGGEYRPVRYRTAFYYRSKGWREIAMEYSKGGARIAGESNAPPENRQKRPAVPEELKKNAADPFTAVLRGRAQAGALFDRAEENFTLPLYDGRRRTDIKFTLHGKTDDGLLKASFLEKPVAGYTNNELKKLETGANIITLYLHPGDLWPLKAEGKSPLGSATAKFEKICATLDACIAEAE